ncbi:MAG: diguanylate cyclase domain-containing protein [Anaerofustis sp.]
MKKQSKLPVYLFVIFVLAWIVVLAVLMPYENLKLSDGHVNDMNDGWTYVDQEGESIGVALPADLHTTPDEPCTISKVLEGDFPDGATLLIRGSLQSVKVTLNGQVLLYAEEEHSGLFYCPMASAWYLIPLPEGAAGQTLSLTFTSPFEAFSGMLNPIVYGNGADVMYSVLHEYFPNFFLIMLIALLGILMIFISIVFHQIGNRALLCLGLFAVALSGWFFAESRMIQFFLGNRFLIGGLAYMMIPVFPIPLLCYLREEILPHFRKVLSAFAILFGLDFVAVTLLQLFGVMGFFQTATISNLILIAAMAYTIPSLFVEIFKYKNVSAKHFICYSGLLLACALIELAKFFTHSFDHLSYFSLIGMFVYIIMLGVDAGKKLRAMVQKHSEAVFYEKMAYHDILTGANNRAAFERDIEVLFRNGSIHNVRLVLFDVNDLKYINDTFGHSEGDEALRRTYRAMEQAFQSPLHCYRIGGDEFTCLLRDCDTETYTSMRDEFILLIEAENQKLDYNFSVAVGSASYEEAHIDDFKELLQMTDQMMYLNKAKTKSETSANPAKVQSSES